MQGSNPQGAPETVFSVPTMTCRHCVRAVSTAVADVVGVLTVEADLVARTVRVRGTAHSAEVCSAIAAAGFDAVVVPGSPRDEGSEGDLS